MKLLGAVLALVLVQDDPYDQSKVPLEVEPTDAKAAKIVLVAGRASHGPGDHEYFAGMALLMDLLKQTPGVAPVMVRDGWPKNEKVFENAKSIVFFCDGGGGHALLQGNHLEVVENEIRKGCGFACLHYGVNFPAKASDKIIPWLGGHILGGYSASLAKQWVAEFKAIPDHPVTRGLKPFTLKDEWYYNVKFAPDMKGVTPLLKAVPPDTTRDSDEAKKYPGREEVTAWAFEREGGGRGFGYTGGHLHKNWGDESIRRLVVNGLLWTAKVEVPKDGAKVDLDPKALERNLDDKRKKK